MSHGQHTGFAIGRVGMRYPLLWFLLSDDPAGIVAELQEVAVFIGHLTRDIDLVSV